ncbi:pectin acetylesterase-family hydrolase [Thermus scotoductus]|uniref:Esterase n=1 Tax=Thermus scotoductus TaxID=37636 RepID=A0A430QZW3_THESC|nr:pectin acetylesterase-family hydrolase [Thermus scotoductus]RTG92042.1 esterase [Thermus scotoductus]RTH00679.1 esterase [Thermus scotoductus]RTH23552.1 esterase [Thermus scotoductus]RTI03221.1 esterase [Thermus scotoductus]RTI17600.1 esterase [Thermus scotoductus]
MKRLISLVFLLALALAQGLEAVWKAVEVPGGVCSDGSPYRFYVSPGDPKKVVIDFQGGGACWNAATCGPQSQTYRKRVDVQELLLAQGIYNRLSVANPFYGWTHVFVPYCTGDLHVGRATVDYGGFKVHHQGARNALAALEYVFRNHTNPEKVFVTGCSAGAYGAVFWADKVLSTYKNAKVAVCGDAGVGVRTPDFPGFTVWNSRLPELPGLSQNPEVAEIYLALAKAFPQARIAQYTTLLDGTQIFFYGLMKGERTPSEATAREWAEGAMRAVLAPAQAENYTFYLAPGSQHCILPRPELYTLKVGEVSFLEWLRALAEGKVSPRVRP